MHLTIQKKQLLIIVIPIVALIFFVSLVVLNDYKEYQQNKRLLSQVNAMQKVAQLIYHLQYERGLSVATVEQKSAFFVQKMQKYRVKVDKGHL